MQLISRDIYVPPLAHAVLLRQLLMCVCVCVCVIAVQLVNQLRTVRLSH